MPSSTTDAAFITLFAWQPLLKQGYQLRNVFGRRFVEQLVIDLATPAILRNPYRRQAIVGDLQQLYAA